MSIELLSMEVSVDENDNLPAHHAWLLVWCGSVSQPIQQAQRFKGDRQNKGLLEPLMEVFFKFLII